MTCFGVGGISRSGGIHALHTSSGIFLAGCLPAGYCRLFEAQVTLFEVLLEAHATLFQVRFEGRESNPGKAVS